MRTGILITARLGSSRLKKKHLLHVNGQPILTYLIKRIKIAFQQEIDEGKIEIVIATSDEPENRQFEMFCSQGLAVFYGSLGNIPLRHLQVAEGYQFDNIISIDGDDILCSVQGMKLVYQELSCGKEFVKTYGLPFGMNVVGYTTKFLRTSLNNVVSEVLETGWGRIFDDSRVAIINFTISNCNDYMRFTLDYSEDFTFFNELITKFPRNLETSKDQEIVDFVESENLYEITKPIAAEYWTNFKNGLEEEINTKER